MKLSRLQGRMHIANRIFPRASLAAPLRQTPASDGRCHTDARRKAPTPAASPERRLFLLHEKAPPSGELEHVSLG